MSETIAAVVVTYNRKQLLTECLDALLAQTRPIDKIILIDNASTDGTPEILKERGYLANLTIEYVRLPENTGGAGGFYEGVKRGYEADYDWLWLMDDDAEPLIDALERMKIGFKEDDVLAVANLPIDKNGIAQTVHRGWIDFCRTDDRLTREVTANDLNGDIVEIKFASFVGIAIKRVVVDKIGYPKKEFFIHYDDVEYCHRIASIGKLVMVNRSVIKHKEARRTDAVSVMFMGRSSKRIPLDRLWLTYYAPRNLVWLRRRYCSGLPLLIYMLMWYLKKCTGIALYDDHKLIRMKFYLSALFDGWFGHFDNQKPKVITKLIRTDKR